MVVEMRANAGGRRYRKEREMAGDDGQDRDEEEERLLGEALPGPAGERAVFASETYDRAARMVST
jgi:hypothetical protein